MRRETTKQRRDRWLASFDYCDLTLECECGHRVYRVLRTLKEFDAADNGFRATCDQCGRRLMTRGGVVYNEEFLERADERNRIRKTLGLPPLSPDGMEVLGAYEDYWLPEHLTESGPSADASNSGRPA